jgi:hypothetical protein
MAKITNHHGVSLPMAVWLLDDSYDYVKDVPNYISVTSLMKPLRQLVIPPRINPELAIPPDVSEFVARRRGHAIHDSLEHTWTSRYHRPLKMLGFPDEVIERIRINPTDDELRASNEIIPIYLEQRELRQIQVGPTTYTIGGKFDFLGEGIIQDFKTTSVWAWIKDDKDEGYQLQMSLYRWLDAGLPEQGRLRRVHEDFGRINFLFSDFANAQKATIKNYPDLPVKHKDIPLMTLAETEAWIVERLTAYENHKATPEKDLPECTDKELWRSDPQFKYFSDPAKAKVPGARSTKNFDTLADANAHLASMGGRGIVVTKLGEPKACGFCPAFQGCTQKDKYL